MRNRMVSPKRSFLVTLAVIGVVLAAMLAAACGSDPTSTSRPANTQVPPTPTSTPSPTATLAPGETPQPTATPRPTNAPVPTATATPRPTAAPVPYYEGKTLRIVVPFNPGGSFDFTGRVVARHISKHLAGNPQVIVQNMPGAGGLRGTLYVATEAPADGLTMVVHDRAGYLQSFLGRDLPYDFFEFRPIGSTSAQPSLVVVRGDLGINSIEDLVSYDRQVLYGTPGKANTAYWIARLVEELFGAEWKFVSEFNGVPVINLAMDAKEVEAMQHGTISILSQKPEWISERFVVPIVQTGRPSPTGLVRDPSFPDTPTFHELLGDNEEGKRLVEFVHTGDLGAWPISVAPGTPQERVDELRQAFIDTTNDPDYIAEFTRSYGSPAPLTGEQLEALYQGLRTPSASLLAKINEVLK
jgi:tripartite-type tricarboxylate transporter receptor subunit TctC